MEPIQSFHGYTDHKPRTRWFLWLLLLCLIGCVVYGMYVVRPPQNFPTDSYIKITPGMSVATLAGVLQSEGYVQSTQATYYTFRIIGRGHILHTGDYYVAKKTFMPVLVFRIVFGLDGLPKMKITIPEGATRTEIANSVEASMPRFSRDVFMSTTKEGYVFPETYYVTRNTTTEEFVELTSAMWNNKMQKVLTETARQKLVINDVLTFASIIEKEARGDNDRKIIAGILWNRLNRGLPLQVDATFLYTIGKSSNELTSADLKSDSPYNTYTHRGLPPTPIDNPGLLAIDAVLNPTKTDYLFYLHDSHGMVHYAKTFAEHQANIARYLR